MTGTYAIQNEKQVSIGESTCSAVFVGKPVYDGGNATLAMEGLTELALERCDTGNLRDQALITNPVIMPGIVLYENELFEMRGRSLRLSRGVC